MYSITKSMLYILLHNFNIPSKVVIQLLEALLQRYAIDVAYVDGQQVDT
jgi:hypothetical protein